ncbi:hypothetical protein AURDEDRAFT_155296 [Auricularia subglabra TFB-10046 SS5]|nr:hypothetical protein AURDEDRAFT_155296 [Auricularia subglabra TFB-10046 SS5]
MAHAAVQITGLAQSDAERRTDSTSCGCVKETGPGDDEAVRSSGLRVARGLGEVAGLRVNPYVCPEMLSQQQPLFTLHIVNLFHGRYNNALARVAGQKIIEST